MGDRRDQEAQDSRTEATAGDTSASTQSETQGCTCGACGGDRAVTSHFYTFCSQGMVPTEKPGYFYVPSFSTLAKNPEHALRMCEKRFGGDKLFCWFLGLPDQPNWTCNMCGGPFHQALGHIDLKQNRLWCGSCTKAMIKFLKSMLVRKWGGVKFYEHATVPQGDTTSSSLEVETPLANSQEMPLGLRDLGEKS